jgi:hypothetical protein
MADAEAAPATAVLQAQISAAVPAPLATQAAATPVSQVAIKLLDFRVKDLKMCFFAGRSSVSP